MVMIISAKDSTVTGETCNKKKKKDYGELRKRSTYFITLFLAWKQ